MEAITGQTAKPRRRWLRFSMRTLLIVVTVLAVPLGWVGWKRGQERATITWVEETGGTVFFRSDNVRFKRSWWKKSTDKCFGERVWLVHFDDTQVSDLSPLAELKNLESLGFSNTQVNDLSPLAELKNLKMLALQNTQVSDLSTLAELKNLERLVFFNTQVSDEQVQELRQALPNCKIYHSSRVKK